MKDKIWLPKWVLLFFCFGSPVVSYLQMPSVPGANYRVRGRYLLSQHSYKFGKFMDSMPSFTSRATTTMTAHGQYQQQHQQSRQQQYEQGRKRENRVRLYMEPGNTSGAESRNQRNRFFRNPFKGGSGLGNRSTFSSSGTEEDGLYDAVKGRRVTFIAEKAAEAPVKEGVRSLQDYLALPPSEYSVLDPECVERIGDDSFRCEISGLNFFGVRMIPVLYVKVIVDPLHFKSTLDIYKLELKGSKIAEKANGTFEIKAKNVVSYRVDQTKGKMLASNVSVDVNALVPRSNIMPTGVMERSGSYIIQGVLNVMVPTFIKVLSKDYQRWATGNDNRAPALLEAGLSSGMQLLDDTGNIDDRLNR